MAGFRIGRGRGSRNAQQRGQYRGPQGQPGQAPPGPGGPGGPRGPGPYGQRPPQQWSQQPGGRGGPEYFDEPHGGHPPYGPGPYAGPRPGPGQSGPAADPYANGPGHTREFSVPDPYGPDEGYGRPAGPPPPRLHWKDLLSGIVFRPNATFWQMRDHAVWLPAITVTFLYGLLAAFGFDETREQVVNNTIATAIPSLLVTAFVMVFAGLILGAVTHTLARQFGGTGVWAPTVGLAMLIMSLAHAPYLVVALVLSAKAPGLVQILGWAAWVGAGALFTSMVSRSHELPWPRALGASAVQLAALLVLIMLNALE